MHVNLFHPLLTIFLPTYLLFIITCISSVNLYDLQKLLFSDFLLNLRTFASIVSAHPYCARKFTPRHQWARALSIKINNDREDRHFLQLCLDLTILDIRWPLLFFPETDFIHNYLHIVQKWTKYQCGKLKEIQDFRSRDIESCHLVTMVAKYGLVLQGTSPVD